MMTFYNFRLCYLIYSKVPCSAISNVRYERSLILITHSIHLILSCGAKIFLIIVSINAYLINIDCFTVRTAFIIVQILSFTLSMLIIKYSLMIWRNIRAKQLISNSSRTPSSGSGGSGNINTTNRGVFPNEPLVQHTTDFMRF